MCTMNTPSGLGTLDRGRVAALLRGTQGMISIEESAKILEMSRAEASERTRNKRRGPP
jgi:hypothetical protein